MLNPNGEIARIRGNPIHADVTAGEKRNSDVEIVFEVKGDGEKEYTFSFYQAIARNNKM